MSWFKKIFKKKESSEIEFQEIPEYLNSRHEKLYKKVSKSCVSFFPDIKKVISDIKKDTDILEKAELEQDVPQRILKIALSNRDNMVKQLRVLVENISFPENKDIDSLIKFHENSMHSLVVCMDNMMKSHRYTKLVFNKESKQIISDLNLFKNILNEFITPINENIELINAYQRVGRLVDEINKINSDIEFQKNTLKDKERILEKLKNDLETEKNKISNLEKSKEWKEYVKLRDEISNLEKESKKIASDIDSLILPLNKGLNRLYQLSESGRYTLNPKLKKELELSLKDRINSSSEFFIEFKNIVEKDVLNISTSKILEQLNLVISNLDKYKKKYQDIQNEIKTKKQKLASFEIIKEKEKINQKTKEINEKLTTIKSEIDDLKKSIDLFEKNLNKNKEELQNTIIKIEPNLKIVFL